MAREPGANRVESFVDSAEARTALYRRSLIVVLISQVFGGAGLAAGVTVGALLAQDMLGGAGVAGLPVALFTLGSALAAYLVGRRSQRAGRRQGLAAGFLAGAVGAIGVVVAAVIDSPALLFVAFFVYGAGTSTNLQARYAGTDLAPVDQRATAVSIAMVSTTFGAVAGPNLVELMGKVALTLGSHHWLGRSCSPVSPTAWPAPSCSCSSGRIPTSWRWPSSVVRRASPRPSAALKREGPSTGA